eukprot:s1955_g5.t1
MGKILVVRLHWLARSQMFCRHIWRGLLLLHLGPQSSKQAKPSSREKGWRIRKSTRRRPDPEAVLERQVMVGDRHVNLVDRPPEPRGDAVEDSPPSCRQARITGASFFAQPLLVPIICADEASG